MGNNRNLLEIAKNIQQMMRNTENKTKSGIFQIFLFPRVVCSGCFCFLRQ